MNMIGMLLVGVVSGLLAWTAHLVVFDMRTPLWFRIVAALWLALWLLPSLAMIWIRGVLG